MFVTTWPKSDEIKRKWWLVDVSNLPLGRVSSKVVALLMGKNKPNYEASVDMGDYVIVINASKVKVTGKKKEQKLYYWHTPYPGGLKQMKLGEMIKKNPEKVIFLAVKRMLPKNKLRDRRLTRLKIFPGVDHPYTAQKPELIRFSND